MPLSPLLSNRKAFTNATLRPQRLCPCLRLLRMPSRMERTEDICDRLCRRRRGQEPGLVIPEGTGKRPLSRLQEKARGQKIQKMKRTLPLRRKTVAFGIDPCDRCNPPIAYREFAITMDCGHGRNCGGVAVLSAPLTSDRDFCYNVPYGNTRLQSNGKGCPPTAL